MRCQGIGLFCIDDHGHTGDGNAHGVDGLGRMGDGSPGEVDGTWLRVDMERHHVGVKRFRDYLLPQGATGIAYRLRATRSTKRGDWATFPVSIGGGRPNFGELHLAA